MTSFPQVTSHLVGNEKKPNVSFSCHQNILQVVKSNLYDWLPLRSSSGLRLNHFLRRKHFNKEGGLDTVHRTGKLGLILVRRDYPLKKEGLTAGLQRRSRSVQKCHSLRYSTAESDPNKVDNQMVFSMMDLISWLVYMQKCTVVHWACMMVAELVANTSSVCAVLAAP